MLNGKFEKGSALVRVNELHIVDEPCEALLLKISDLPTITEIKQAIKRPAKYIIPLRSWFRIDDNVKKQTRIKGDNLYAV